MSIVTKSGDSGATALMFNRRVPKTHPRIEASGCVDALNSALGLARAAAQQTFIRDNLLSIQKDLVILMGEISTLTEDLPRYLQASFSQVTPQLTAKLDQLAGMVEEQGISGKDWVMPGTNPSSAALDWARTSCRSAERRVCALSECEPLPNPEIVVYLNRLSDVLWLLARWVENQISPKLPE